PLADPVHAGVDPRVLAGVEVAERAAERVRHRHAQAVVAVRLDRDADGRCQPGEPVPDAPRGVAADRVAVADPVSAGVPGGQRELQQEPVVGPGPVFGVDPDGGGAAGLGRVHGAGHLPDDGIAVEPPAELLRQHLLRGGDGQVVVLKAQGQGLLDVGGHAPAPARQQQAAERAGLGQRHLSAHVRNLVEQEREADLGLRHAEPPKVEVHHRLTELGQPGPRGLHAVAVGHVEEVNVRHAIHVDANRESTSILILINMEASITAAEAARRLGVKPATIYAYVSRGVLRRHKDSEGRRSLFDAAQVEELARGGRPRRPPAPAELVIESSITALRDGRPFYRGRDVLELAGSWSFEQAALWLWDEGTGDAGPWPTVPEALPPAIAAQSGLPVETRPRERIQVITAALA